MTYRTLKNRFQIYASLLKINLLAKLVKEARLESRNRIKNNFFSGGNYNQKPTTNKDDNIHKIKANKVDNQTDLFSIEILTF